MGYNFSFDQRSRGGKKGGKQRLANLGVARRREIASLGGISRMIRRMGWDPLDPDPAPRAIVEEKLYKLRLIEAQQWAEKDIPGVLDTISRQFPWVRLKLSIEVLAANKGGLPLEVDNVAQEAATKYAIARKQREETTIDGTAERTSPNNKD